MLSYLDSGSINTSELENEFFSYYKNVSVDFYECLPNRTFGLYLAPVSIGNHVSFLFNADLCDLLEVVDRVSATRTGHDRYPLDTDHFGLNKYESDEDQSYLEVKAMIVDMVRKRISKFIVSEIRGPNSFEQT